MSTQNSNPDNHAYVFETLVVLKNKDLMRDFNWAEIIKPIVGSEWMPDITNDYNRTIITKDQSVYKLDIWMNIAAITPVKIKHRESDKMIAEIQSILRYMVTTIKRLQPIITLTNESAFKIFVYLSTDTDIPGFEKKNSNTIESVFGQKVNRRKIEYYQTLKFNDNYELIQSIYNQPHQYSFNNQTSQQSNPFNIPTTSQSQPFRFTFGDTLPLPQPNLPQPQISQNFWSTLYSSPQSQPHQQPHQQPQFNNFWTTSSQTIQSPIQPPINWRPAFNFDNSPPLQSSQWKK